MDKIINILLLVIIFVFDPLAISLVIAANFAFDQAKPKKNLYGEIEDDFNEWDDLDDILNDYEVVPVDEEEIDPKEIEVIDPEIVEPVVEDWKVVDENDQEIKSKKVKRVLQKSPTKRRVEFDDGSQGWIDKGDEDKIVYM